MLHRLDELKTDLLDRRGLPENAPVLLASGGVDNWKMDLQRRVALLANQIGVRVVAFDVPGTGESDAPVTSDGGAQTVRRLIASARLVGDDTVAHLASSLHGRSLLGHHRSGWRARRRCRVGQPVQAAFTSGDPAHFDMAGIVDKGLGSDTLPDPVVKAATFRTGSLRLPLDTTTNAPILVINGAGDVRVPHADTPVFEDRRDTEVHRLPPGPFARSRRPRRSFR